LVSLRLIVGGFSPNAYLSEVGTSKCRRTRIRQCPRGESKGDFGTNWYALADPIRRYVKGWDPAMMDAVSTPLPDDPGTAAHLDGISGDHRYNGKHEYGVPFAAMPMQEGIAYTRFF